MSKSQRKRRLRRRQVAAQPRSTGTTAPRRATVAFTGSLLTTAALAAPTALPAQAAAPTPTAAPAAPASSPRAAAPGADEVVALVRDINPGARGSSVGETVALGDVLLMSLYDRDRGTELWRSDGSEAGTRLVKDINTRVYGRQSRPGSSNPRGFTLVGDEVWFTADDGVNGRELWSTDGTAAGTVRETTVPGADSDDGYDYYAGTTLTEAGGALYFTADDGVHGLELWKTDDSAQGASMVADIHPGSRRDRPNSSSPGEITALGDAVLFTADDGVHGAELWRSDGTAEGTTLVRDIRPGTEDQGYGEAPARSRSRYLTAVGDRVYFSADDGEHGHELWSTDGTTEGTAMVSDLRTVASEEYEEYPDYVPSSRPRALTAVGGTLYFSAADDEHGRELWRADGLETRLVADIDPSDRAYSYVGYDGFTVLDGVLYFSADDGEHGTELWRSNGTAAGTRMVKDLAPGTSEGRRPRPYSSSPTQLTVVGDDLFLVARDRSGTRSLWTSDGTREGTELFAAVGHESPGYGGYEGRRESDSPSYGGYGSGAQDLTAVGDELFFTADDGIYGNELWSTADAAAAVPRIDSTTRPRIQGETVAGGVLTATAGEWSPSAGLDHAYQWYVDGRAIRTATRPRFRPGSSDVGSRITVRVIATKPGWRGQLAYSATTAEVEDEPLVNLARPAAVGEAEVGKRLVATRGRWSVKGLRFSFAWRIDGKAVRGADSRFFRLPARAAGKTVTVRVTARRPAGAKSVVSRPRQVQR